MRPVYHKSNYRPNITSCGKIGKIITKKGSLFQTEEIIIKVRNNSFRGIFFQTFYDSLCITKRNYFFAAKRRNVRREQIPIRQELNIFFGSIPFYFPPISNISILLKNTKMYIFPTYSPKRILQSHILRGCLKNSANKICDVMYG